LVLLAQEVRPIRFYVVDELVIHTLLPLRYFIVDITRALSQVGVYARSFVKERTLLWSNVLETLKRGSRLPPIMRIQGIQKITHLCV
jgi:hypothetical protein